MIYADCCDGGRQLIYCRTHREPPDWVIDCEDTLTGILVFSFCPFCGRKLGESAELSKRDRVMESLRGAIVHPDLKPQWEAALERLEQKSPKESP